MGANGKFFPRGLARGLGFRGRVTSPTFTIVNEYEGTLPLFHFDMYRLGDEEDLFDIGWEDYLSRGGVCAVEWSERVGGALPPETVRVTISRCPEDPDCPLYIFGFHVSNRAKGRPYPFRSSRSRSAWLRRRYAGASSWADTAFWGHSRCAARPTPTALCSRRCPGAGRQGMPRPGKKSRHSPAPSPTR